MGEGQAAEQQVNRRRDDIVAGQLAVHEGRVQDGAGQHPHGGFQFASLRHWREQPEQDPFALGNELVPDSGRLKIILRGQIPWLLAGNLLRRKDWIRID
jgi:hypothetical protein